MARSRSSRAFFRQLQDEAVAPPRPPRNLPISDTLERRRSHEGVDGNERPETFLVRAVDECDEGGDGIALTLEERVEADLDVSTCSSLEGWAESNEGITQSSYIGGDYIPIPSCSSRVGRGRRM